MRTGSPNARLAVVEGPGHESDVDEPEECFNAVQYFSGALSLMRA